jgi:carbonic anhydrase
MDKLAAGVAKFQAEAFEAKKALFRALAEGQAPEALFITCSDSRIDPTLLTQTSPGELFICRNAGNIVPPHTNHTGGMTASIEYAVGALNVPNIIICGHSGCGAMKGAMAIESLSEFPHVREWLGFARAAALIVAERAPGASPEEKLALLAKENVILQLAHIRTHPYVAARLAGERVRLHGWYYDIGSGQVLAYNEARKDFIPVAEHYSEPVGAALKPAQRKS